MILMLHEDDSRGEQPATRRVKIRASADVTPAPGWYRRLSV